MRVKKHQVLSVIFICVSVVLAQSIDQKKLEAMVTPPPQEVAQLPVAPIPIERGSAPKPDISAVAAVAIDQQAGAVLFEKNAEETFAPASTTKLMTALVARQVYASGAILTVPPVDVVGTTIGLTAGEQLSLDSVLEGALIPSGNDAAYTLAANYTGGVSGFVALMNEKVKELHLKRTHFNNPTGLDAADHASTAHDLALIAREVMKDPDLRSIVGTKQTTIFDLTGKKKHAVTTTNHLLLSDPQVVGIKTGTTEEAGQVLIVQVNADNHSYIIVVMGSSDRYLDTTTIRNWIENRYTWKTPAELSMVY